MNIDKRVRLTIHSREEIWHLYQACQWKESHLAKRFRMSRQNIYKALKQHQQAL